MKHKTLTSFALLFFCISTTLYGAESKEVTVQISCKDGNASYQLFVDGKRTKYEQFILYFVPGEFAMMYLKDGQENNKYIGDVIYLYEPPCQDQSAQTSTYKLATEIDFNLP